VELIYANNPRRHYRFADDKLVTKECLREAGVPAPETLAVCEGFHHVPGAIDKLENQQRFVVKPAGGSGGQGVLVVGEQLAPGRWRRAGGAELDIDGLKRHLANILYGTFSKDVADRAFVERRIEPHPLLRELWADGLSDIRVITLNCRPLISMLRVPTRRSEGRANLHQGAVGLAVNLATGRTFRAWHGGAWIERHPETGLALIGVQIPEWEKVLDVARRAARSVPLKYLGVDLVLDENASPIVLELNARPGLEIQNVHGQCLGGYLEQIAT
jgi:alpha-L-glutamate ligase-like protein